VQVHRARLARQVGRLDLSPTEALRLAEEGRSGLSRRGLPPDTTDRTDGDDAG
jgi:hypothetical protein